MKEYPTSTRMFKLGDKTHTMMMITLGLQSKIEDDNITVTQREVITGCTDLSDEEIEGLHIDQFTALYSDIIELSYEGIESSGEGDGGEPKKP